MSTADLRNKSVANHRLHEFRPFQRLPKDVRLMIWDLTVDGGRILGVRRELSLTVDKMDHTKGWKVISTRTPSLLWINRESRAHALKIYRLLLPPEMDRNLYVNDKVDSVCFLTPLDEEDNDDDVIYSIATVDGEMELACTYPPDHGKRKAPMIDYMHLDHGATKPNLYMDHAEYWAAVLRHGDIEAF
ncbi:hypothetical protein B7494_g2750 [Chlorociboria aeruginascens]|nr:hypothetical protein B7494_g2750 [Chlorociboria aeruginascens]